MLKQATRTVDGTAFKASAFAFAPDETQPSGWKLRLFDSPADESDKNPSVHLTAVAALALSAKGYRGERVTPTETVKALVAKAWLRARRTCSWIVGEQDLPASLKKAATHTEAPTASEPLGESITVSAEKAENLIRLLKANAYTTLEDWARDIEIVTGFAVPQVGKADLSTPDLAAGGVLQAAQDPKVKPTKPPVDDPEDVIKVSILSKSEDERTVFGIVLEPETIDSQNDIYNEEEIRKTAFRFMEEYQQFGLMHKNIIPAILPLESYIAPVDFEVDGQKIKKGTWLLRVRVMDDTIWGDVKTGKLTGFSIGGSAMRTPDVVNLTHTSLSE